MSGIINHILELLKNKIIHQKNKLFLLLIVILLYIFIIIIFKTLTQITTTPPTSTPYSCFDLVEFIGGYRSPQQDFEVEKIRFTEKLLIFTLNLKFSPNTDFVPRKLAMDIAQGLISEYPRLKFMRIDVIRKISPDSFTVYGQAEYDRDTQQIIWKAP